MSINQQTLAQKMLAEVLWWACSENEEGYALSLSPGLSGLFEKPIVTIADMTGRYSTPLIQIKIKEILASPQSDIRFVSAFDTLHGKLSFQHRLKCYEDAGHFWVWAECIDISERVELEREIVDAQGRLSLTQVYERQALLEEQNRFIRSSYNKQSRFLALLSHELRSPLLGISSLSERLKRQYANSPDIVDALKVIHLTSEQAIFLVNDILTYSQTEYDAMTLHPVRFSLRTTLENVKQLTKSIANDKGLMVSLVYLGKQDWVLGDSVRLSQILINLIVNSIKFTKYGGVSIEISQKKAGYFHFEVTDSGEGIAEARLKQIFEPFAQLESLGSTQYLGAGLGLFIVQQLVALMGGTVAVKSKLGVGTSFNFDLKLPLALPNNQAEESLEDASESPIFSAVESQAMSAENPHEQAVAKQHFNILVADDSQINRMVLTGYLKDLDCQVYEARDGKEAWDLFQEVAFDYVFLDIQMPFLDGVEVCRNIQQEVKSGRAEKLKGVFAITAGGHDSQLISNGDTYCTVGFSEWLVKPVSKKQIISLLESYEQKLSLACTSCQEATLDVTSKTVPTSSAVPIDKMNVIDDVPVHFHGLMDAFLIEVKEGISNLQAANKLADWKAVKGKAHYLKGNCMLFQLDYFVDLLRRVESLAEKSNSIADTPKKVKKTLEKLSLAIKYLEKSRMIRHNES